MKQGISKRIGRIIAGTFNAGIDSAEAGADIVVLEQTIRETDDAIDELIVEQNSRRADHYNASRRLAAIETKQSSLSEDLATAIAEKMDEHARQVIAMQMDLEKQQPVVREAIKEAEMDMEEYDESIEALRAKRREMQAELAEYRRMKAASDAESSEKGEAPASIAGTKARRKAEQAANTFTRVVERNTGLPSGLSSGVKSAQALQELQEVSRKNRIEERLAAAKASLEGEAEKEAGGASGEQVSGPATVSAQE